MPTAPQLRMSLCYPEDSSLWANHCLSPFVFFKTYKCNPRGCSQQKRIQGVKIAKENISLRASEIEMQTTVWYIKCDSYTDVKREGEIFKRKNWQRIKRTGTIVSRGAAMSLIFLTGTVIA